MKKTISVIYIMIVAVLAAATILGEKEGMEYAKKAVYGSWWFALAWWALAVCGMYYIIRWGRRSVMTLLLHGAFAVILLGAFVTHTSATQGYIHLRKGSYSTRFMSEATERHLPFAMRLDNFSVQMYCENGNIADYTSKITIADMHHNILSEGRVSMNNIMEYKGWRLYQWAYDDDGMGATLVINRDPWGIAITYTGYAILFVSITAAAFTSCRRMARRRRNLGTLSVFEKSVLVVAIALSVAVMLAGACFFVTQLLDNNPWISDMQPILNSPWLSVHVSIITVSYLLLLLTAVCSITALCGGNGERLRLVSLTLLHPAIAALAIGIFVGAIWANVSWGTYWSWDPKEVWALITMMVYAIALHEKRMAWLRRPKAFHAFIAISFLSILMTFFGVNCFLSGMHSYA